MTAAASRGRRCLACNAIEQVAAHEPIWPLGRPCAICGHVVAESNGIATFAPELAGQISGFDPKHFDELRALESDFFWFVARNRLIAGLTEKYFPEAQRFLEIGCGNGVVLDALAKRRRWERLVGSELQPAGLAHARQRMPAQVELVQMDARDIPAQGVFDLVGAFDVIEHIEEDEAVLRGLRAATMPGGGAIIAVPQHPWLWSDADDIAHHQRRYRRGELEAKMKRSGFEIIFSTSYVTLLLPLMVASRIRRRGNVDRGDIYQELRLPPLLNSALKAVLRLETGLTLSGLRWPAGGSRIVVGRAV